MPLDEMLALWQACGMNLVDYLAKEHLNPNSFARKLGVPSSTVHRWVQGKRRPSIGYLIKIERATGKEVQPKDFYSISEAAQ